MNIEKLEASIGAAHVTPHMEHQRTVLRKLGIEDAFFSAACEEFTAVSIQEIEKLQKRIEDTFATIERMVRDDAGTDELVRYIVELRR